MLSAHGPPLLFALFAWWFSTGAILCLNRARGAESWALLAMTAVGAVSLACISETARDASAASAYLAFVATLGIWGWQELAFLTGAVTGPRTDPCPADAKGWRRFALATSTIIYHEIALALGGALILAVTWNQPNQTAAFAYGVLFVMRISAKLNLFFGVPNFSDDFMPARLAHLSSYFRRAPFTAAFPISLAIGAALCFACARAALAAEPGGAAQIGATLGFALAALALLEHLFMVAPVRDTLLWRWALAAPRLNTDPGRTK